MLALVGFLAKDGPTRRLGVVLQVIEVQTDVLGQPVKVDLIANLRGAVDQRHAFVGLLQTDAIGHPSQHAPGRFVVAGRGPDVTSPLRLVVEIADLDDRRRVRGAFSDAGASSGFAVAFVRQYGGRPPHDVSPDLNGPALARNASVELSQRSTVVLVAPDEV